LGQGWESTRWGEAGRARRWGKAGRARRWGKAGRAPVGRGWERTPLGQGWESTHVSEAGRGARGRGWRGAPLGEGRGEGPRLREPPRQLACKPDSVVSSHPSQRPTWTSAGNLRTVLLGLASGGVCQAAASPRRRCALTAPFHPCRPAEHGDGARRADRARKLGRCVFCGTFPRVSPGRRYRPPCPAMSGLSSKGTPSAAARPAARTVARTHRLGAIFA
jgi:hypothetical protein